MKAWITRYVLTEGIRECEGESSDGKYFYQDGLACSYGPAQWHATRDAAVVKARQMLRDAIASRQNSIAEFQAKLKELR